MNKYILCFILLPLFFLACKNDADKEVVNPTDKTTIVTSTTINNELKKYKVSTSQFVMDSAGFHDMNSSLTTNQIVDPNYNSVVKKVKKVLENTNWPTDLNSQAQIFIANLGLFSEALAANNVADAVALSETVHDEQHDLSSAIDTWASTFTDSDTEVDSFGVAIAQYVLDSAGFHEMSEDLTTTQTIDSTSNSIVKRVKKVLENTTWPTELNTSVQAFIVNLGLLSTALAANNVADAIIFADTIHDDGHSLSSSIDSWQATYDTSGSAADVFDISVAQFVMDSAGFHGMEENLTTNQSIDTTYNSIVKKAKKVLANTIWPSSLATQANEFIENLDLFSAALAINNVADAEIISGTIHENQHDLSDAIDEWLDLN